MLAGIIRLLKLKESQLGESNVLEDGPFKGMKLPSKTPEANAAYVFREVIGDYLITHPHLDHISAIAINSPMIQASHRAKRLHGLPSVISAIKNHIFNNIIWPNLSNEEGGAGLLTYHRLKEASKAPLGEDYVEACQGITTKCLGVSHGHCKLRDSPNVTAVESSAFFLHDDKSGDEIIVFGDVEPDSLSYCPRNRLVWEAAAPKIADGKLRAIFIECSYTDSVEDDYLYGHLRPQHLAAELTALADKVMDSRDGATGSKSETPDPQRWAAETRLPLDGLHVYIIHIKETLADEGSPGPTIVNELREHAKRAHLGCEFGLPEPEVPIWV